MKPSEYFADEINGIKNEAMREFAKKYVDEFPPYFMINPASSTGKYHAAWSNTKGSEGVAGGLAKHVKVMCFWVNALADSEMLTSEEKDAAIVATLGHDAIKYGFGGGKYTTKTHESEGAIFFKRCLTKHKAENLPFAKEIFTAIAFHQGRWAVSAEPKVFPDDFDKIAQIVHRADMNSSRPGVEYTFLKEESLIG